MKAGANLVKVVGCAHTPFHIIVSENVVTVCELCGVAVGLVGLSSFAAVNVGGRVEIDVIFALGWSVSQVVETGCNVLSETTDSESSH